MTPDDYKLRLARLGLLLKDVEVAAREFVRKGVRLTPDGLIVREAPDKSDPYCKLCDALDAIDPLNPKNSK